MTVKGLMLHSVATPQPEAEVFINAWNKPNITKCVHAFIQADGKVYQTLPWNIKGWHGGKSYSNNYYIGVEMCEPATIKYLNTACTKIKDNNLVGTKNYVMGTYNTAVELFAYLCKQFNLDPMTDILSHKEGYKKGIASNHGDPEHLWVKYGLTMNDFRRATKQALESPFLVRIITNSLNIRTSPEIANNVVGKVYKNDVYTIIETKDGWGKLKSGVGWIKITEKYCKRL
ncbi:MAG: N-acetylmuramoyl-L-alanine amidase [Methanobrevibacter sp.]|uniref:N-acetylmuramoyl-L-alanine amidase n=1 Tax=Methanobrevibacter sp. TaxID=66852 RepID=UPI0031F4F3A0|nr:N-acetylmuramoyl-L-alanine amidase [Methanobrevibacter sp.]